MTCAAGSPQVAAAIVNDAVMIVTGLLACYATGVPKGAALAAVGSAQVPRLRLHLRMKSSAGLFHMTGRLSSGSTARVAA